MPGVDYTFAQFCETPSLNPGRYGMFFVPVSPLSDLDRVHHLSCGAQRFDPHEGNLDVEPCRVRVWDFRERLAVLGEGPLQNSIATRFVVLKQAGLYLGAKDFVSPRQFPCQG